LIGNIAAWEYQAMNVDPLPPDRFREAARLLADAFLDYPAWRAIGPRRERARWRMVNRFYRGALDAVHPREPHVFLHTIGVDPRSQRAGAGTALLEHMIADADDRAAPIHLTTSAAENLPYYRRFGFQLDGERRLPRDVPLWSMLRPAAGRT
jgi:GNAT superfamily N-acetyltransferase